MNRGPMMSDVCNDCTLADLEPLHCVYTDRWCCRARMVTTLVGASGAGITAQQVKREACRVLRDRYPEDWEATRARIEVLVGGGNAAGARQIDAGSIGKGSDRSTQPPDHGDALEAA